MATKPASLSFGQLLRVFCAQDSVGRTDGQLVERFLVHQDEAAFAALVRRHGPMVLGVCRRILGNDADSEDAFQATFLVLVRKATSLASRSVLGDWLHGVARHTALKARAATAHRRAKEQATARPNATAEENRNDWLPLLDEELARLPEKFRLPIVLCDLEGKTRREAAEELGWPEGTVAGRLARARTMLAKRLARLSGGAFAVALAQDVASAYIPRSLLVSTVKAAGAFSAGQSAVTAGTIPVKVTALTERVLQAMYWNKIKNGAMIVICVVFAVIGGGFTFHALAGDGQPMQPESRAETTVREPSKEPWGPTTQGLQMSISASGKDKDGSPEFQVMIRNVGEQDVSLNLGIMLANGKPLNGGKSLFPTNIRLNLKDAKGKTRELHLREPSIAGRVDDYVVPLRGGSVYTLKLSLSQFWSPATKEFTSALPGKHQVSAQFEGGVAKHDSGRFIMNFWEGNLQSNTLKLDQ